MYNIDFSFVFKIVIWLIIGIVALVFISMYLFTYNKVESNTPITPKLEMNWNGTNLDTTYIYSNQD